MRLAKVTRIITTLFLFGCFGTQVMAQSAQDDNSIPDFEKDSTKKRRYIDFGLELPPVSNPDMLFSHFANRKLLIFFFSAKCVHCQRAFPHVQKLAKKLEAQGVSSIGIAIKNNSESDIRQFIRQFNCDIPVFHDSERKFSNPYGTGSIPLILAVNDRAEYIRFRHFKEDVTPGLIEELFASGRIDK